MKNVILIVLDGYGIAPAGPGNAVTMADPKNITSFTYSYPHTTLKASGEAVGLPPNEVGNTEVGHINMGAGKIVYQDLPKINMSIADGTFYQNKTFIAGIEHIKKTGGNLHVMGLIGEGVVHASVEHLFALLNFAKQQGVKNVFVHAITDGRDSPPKSALDILTKVEETMTQLQTGKIASVTGRYYAMDRDKRWERIQKAYICLTKGEGQVANSSKEAVESAYKKSQTDEFIEPTIITQEGKPLALIKKGDSVIFFNYRIDRPRELSKAFVLDNFEADANKTAGFDPYAVKYHKTHTPQEEDATSVTKPFVRGEKISDLFFISMTEYEKGLPCQIAFPPSAVHMPLGRVISEQGIFQLRLSESEKERFVTFYFNGLKEDAFAQEERIIVPSPKVPTYDLKPEMSAREVTDILIAKMQDQKYKFILVNFANADMVGHTGNLQASIIAVGVLDECLAKITQHAMNHNYSVIITADHGNVEEKINPHTGQMSTEHTANPVPFIVIDKDFFGKGVSLQSGILADLAPTILSLMGLQKPADMTGRNLLEELSL